MDTTLLTPPTSRRHRRHSVEFKAQAVEACMQPGVSIAAVALANQLNANMLRSWVKAHRDQHGTDILTNDRADPEREMTHCHASTLVPVAIEVADAKGSSDIQIEIHRQQTVFQIAWPISQAAACAGWLRDLLR